MNEKIDIEKIIQRLKDRVGIKTDKELANILGLSPNNFFNQKKRGSLLSILIDWAMNEKVDLQEFIVGEKVSQPPAEKQNISFDSLGMAEGMTLLGKIYSSGDTTYIRAINANLAAFGGAIDNKVIAVNTIQMLDEMRKELKTLEDRVHALEEENAELAKIGEMRRAAANE